VQFCEFAIFFAISLKFFFSLINLLPIYMCYSYTFFTYLIHTTMRPLNVMIAVLGSAAAGLFAGMLLAPRKGSETRENVMDFIRRHCRELKTVHPPKV
jgi:hypothetical protein